MRLRDFVRTDVAREGMGISVSSLLDEERLRQAIELRAKKLSNDASQRFKDLYGIEKKMNAYTRYDLLEESGMLEFGTVLYDDDVAGRLSKTQYDSLFEIASDSIRDAIETIVDKHGETEVIDVLEELQDLVEDLAIKKMEEAGIDLDCFLGWLGPFDDETIPIDMYWAIVLFYEDE